MVVLRLVLVCEAKAFDLARILVRITYRGDFALLESAENAVDLKFSVDIRLLLLDIRRLVDVGSHFGPFICD